MAWQPRKFKPQHVNIVRLAWQGYTVYEIAQFIGMSEAHVSSVINCDEAQALFSQLREHAINSSDEIQDEAQLIAPRVMQEKIRLALEADDERVRNIACSDILAIAGHTPVKKMEITRSDVSRDSIAQKTPAEIRKGILEEIGITDDTNTNTAPDGTLLN